MTTLKIDKKVPLPTSGKGVHRYGEPMELLVKGSVGDSFYVPGLKSTQVQTALSRWKYKLGIEITTRSENGGVRVWRTK